MELDDLKQSWKQAEENIKPLNTNIMELIQNKSYGPIATLKSRFRKPLILLPVITAIVLINLSKHHDLLSDVLFWFYITICLVMCSYFFFSYRLVNKMQCMDCRVKANLEQQVTTLEKAFTWRLIAIRIIFILFIVLLEVLLYFHQEPSLAKWYTQPLPLRLVTYAGSIALFFLVTRLILNRKYGKHIHYLKALVQQMQ